MEHALAHSAQVRESLSVPALSKWRPVLWIIWLVALAAGIVGVWQRLTLGHLPAGYGSYVPWGLWIALYFHGVGMAGGVFVLSALGFLLGWRGFKNPNALRMAIVLSLACITPGFLAVYFDLGHMDRSHHIFTSPNFTSMMAFNAWMYTAYTILAVLIWWLSYKEQSNWLRPLLWVGLVLSIMFPSQSGAFFGVVASKPFWHSPLLPMLFLTSAIAAGGALLLAVKYLAPSSDSVTNRADAMWLLRRITIGAVLAYLVLEFAEFSISLWNPVSHAPALDLVLWGPYWWVFWLVHLLIGVIVALGILWTAKSPAWWTVAGIIIAVTFVSTRLNVLVPGQAVGEIQGLQNAFSHERLTYIYHATRMEYLVGLFLLAVGLTVYYVGLRVTNGFARQNNQVAES